MSTDTLAVEAITARLLAEMSLLLENLFAHTVCVCESLSNSIVSNYFPFYLGVTLPLLSTATIALSVDFKQDIVQYHNNH